MDILMTLPDLSARTPVITVVEENKSDENYKLLQDNLKLLAK